MFQTLTPNQKLYILHKMGTPRLVEGIVQNVSPVKTIPSTQFGGMPTQTVDVTVLAEGQTYPYTLPASAVIGTLSGNGGITVSMSKEAMNNEIQSLRQASVDVINSVDRHRDIISVCDSIWQQMNPEAMEKERQRQEFDELKGQVSSLKDMFMQFMEMQRGRVETVSADKNIKNAKNKE